MSARRMKAAVYRGPGQFGVEDVPIPEVAAGEMLVRVDVCGVCGTDVKKIRKGLLPGPRVFGHEIAGSVARTGRGVTRFREGDRVVVHHHVPCGSCFYCARKLFAQCPGYKRNGTTAGFEPAGGGFAEYVKAMDWIVERGAIAVPAGVPAEVAAFVEPVNTCLKAVERAELAGGRAVLVVGQGPIGLLLLQLARLAGAEVFVTDLLEDRLALARRLGAALALRAGADAVARVREATGGRGVDCALLAALGQRALTAAIDATRPGGRIIVFAATSPGERVELDLGALCADEKEVLTSYSSSVDVQQRAARLVFEREVAVSELITHRLSLEEAPRAIELAANAAPGVLKVVFDNVSERERDA
jgi:L-iditol 2-dehydrogenase